MDERTLEEKLKTVCDNIKHLLNDREMVLDEYMQITEELLLNEEVVDERRGIDYKNPSNYIAERFMFTNDHFNSHFGLKNDYISVNGSSIKSSEVMKDIQDYENLYERTKSFVINDIKPEELTKKEFYETVAGYVLNQEEVKGIDEKRIGKFMPKMINSVIMDLSFLNFRMQEINYNGYSHTQLDNALEKVNSGNGSHSQNMKEPYVTRDCRERESKVMNFLSSIYGGL